MQIQSNCMQYLIILRKFSKKAQTTFGVVAKGNLVPSVMYKQMNDIIAAIRCMYKIEHRTLKFASGIRELHEAPIRRENLV
jgi:hypothetical protein